MVKGESGYRNVLMYPRVYLSMAVSTDKDAPA